MTLDEAKQLLSSNGIPFEQREFQNEAAYWRHAMLFPYTKNAKPCMVIALIIRSNNTKKHIELQFNATDDQFCFEELRFGGYCYEMFDYNEEMLPNDLIRNIFEIMGGKLAVIVLNDIKRKHWLADACFDLNDDDDFWGAPGFQAAMHQIQQPRRFLSKLLRSSKQYEIYDWNTYQCILK